MSSQHKTMGDAQIALVAAWRKHPELRESLDGIVAKVLSEIVFHTEMLSKQAEGLAGYVRRNSSDEDEIVRVACHNIDLQIKNIISICGEVNQHGIRVYGDDIDRDVD
ncbi:hypothetical protein [Pseudomonas aeruginosa]|uniref:hypothetical protein n=1 Tax=Pseudomonas aeruginosa TaxID=287 RepID=UPI00093FCAE2|nr:hypothetical protein [Pseudomonas aeruginosa]ELL7118947.1 hypothetical protein [Pseudomonas aeruginosa]PBM76035.1 hypothetical protein B8A60_30765 [Pseudomonas aeruginosa]TEL81077.1 hypothetical protein IPC175_10730 [Pseudomonas aeruginosa]HBO3780575.1 hypothetical protein [Pseudomonas aeruginosa]HCE6351598.1 hypothetical protein [Pseudomonas aeruginosa]